MNATLSGFLGQPSAAEGQSWKFKDMPVGTTYIGLVARATGDADVRPVSYEGRIQTQQDGQAKLLLIVPMLVIPDQKYPDGKASLWLKGALWTQLNAAMARVGAPAGTPEAGALIQVSLVGIRPIPGKNAAFEYQAIYWRPDDPATLQFTEQQRNAPTLQVAPQQMQQVQAPPATWMPAPQYGQPSAPAQAPAAQYAQPQYAQPQAPAPGAPTAEQIAAYMAAQAQGQAPPATAPPAPQAAAPAPPQQYQPAPPAAVAQPAPAAAPTPDAAPAAAPGGPPPGMTAEQFALWQKLTAQQAAQPAPVG